MIARRFLWLGALAGPGELTLALASDPTPQISAVKFQMGLIEGFAAHGVEIYILGALPITPYPRSKTVFVRKARFSLPFPNVSGLLMWDVNLPFVRLIVRLLASIRFGIRALRSSAHYNGIIVYPLHSPFLVAAILLKRLFKVPVFVFIPDLPMHTAGRKLRGLHAFAKRLDNSFLRFLISRVNLTFPITEGSARAWLPDSVKHLVVEGIAPAAKPAARKTIMGRPPQILYTGQFSHILRFAEIFSSQRDIEATLVFVGGGPDLDGLNRLAATDPRIKVKPFVTGDAFEKEFEAADFLLNPRDTRWEGAKFSFPSKLFDYMARGRPILSTRMPGIPDEYFACFLEVSDDSAQMLAQSLKHALATPPEQLSRRIDVGETMLVSTKSPYAVTGRILEAIARC